MGDKRKASSTKPGDGDFAGSRIAAYCRNGNMGVAYDLGGMKALENHQNHF
jgi:hypothetical protein